MGHPSVRCGAGADKDRYNEEARADDARQYGVWGVDGIRQRSSSFAAMEEDWETEVARVWADAGASEVATQRLLILGAKWQKGALGEIYRDAQAVATLVRTLRELLPGANPAAVFHLAPETALVCVDRHELMRRLVAMRAGVGIDGIDLARVVSHEPALMLLDEEALAEEGMCAEDWFRSAAGAVRDAVVRPEARPNNEQRMTSEPLRPSDR